MARADTLEDIKEAVKQLAKIINDQVRESFGNSNYDRAVEELGVMRSELIELEEPSLYNEMLRKLKQDILSEALGGDRREMWWHIRKTRLGLIDRHTSAVSEVREEEAKEFMVAKL